MMLLGFLSLLLLTGTTAENGDLIDPSTSHGDPEIVQQDGNTSYSESQEVIEDRLMPNYTDDFNDIIYESIRETGINFSEDCRFENLLNHLNLTKSNEKFTVSRPVQSHKRLTWVLLEMKIYAILDVRETDQTFISYVWIYLRWDNEHIWWEPEQFCGIKHLLVPTQMLWMPDLTIEEMTEQDKASPSPYLNIRHHGWVEFRNDEVVISTCRMHVFRFPFDTQTCNLSFKSIMYSDEEIKLFYNKNDSDITELTRETMQTQYEWLFIGMSVQEKTVNHFGFNQTMIIYTIKMKRRSVLYIANFLLPIFFFLCLDLASLLMSDSGGDKIGFKITVLLSVTVMQLILKDILPCSSDRIPLIAIYCIGIFTLMLLSLLETILVMHLIDKDNKTDTKQRGNEKQVDKQGNSCFKEKEKPSLCVSDVSAGETPSVDREGSSRHSEVSLVLEKVSDELEEIRRTVALLSGSKEEEMMPGYWTELAGKINKVFTVFYISASILFLAVIFTVWGYSED
ncbi:5-hydroxytryptamine receptor 3E-like [Cololabis saira]|uniref:5-hydroxytryptamine receptor 3E-like n=1 Tax=Cololabis saira TaxID=129043 RepID=UPI002AD42639|nr:5-hydroxytryptamine receptor 3E-like [Cololabis saira]